MLVCEDKQIEAHKLVISSCSPVLENILKLNQTFHPVIYLRKVKYRDLQNLLNFMYQGEANVSEEDLNNFLEIAEDLNMRGLSEKNTDYQRSMKDNISQVENNISQIEDNISQVEDNISQVEDDISQVNLKTSYPSGIDNYNEDLAETFFNNDIDTKPLIVPECKKNNQESVVYKDENIISTNEVQNIEGRYPCGQCEYKASKLDHLNRHIKSIHEGERHPCPQCDYQGTQSASLTHHVKSVYEGMRYPCDQCNYKATRKTYLRSHQFKHHT